MLNPHHCTPAVLPAGPPILVVTIDAEEEFDWSQPLTRTATAVTHMREVGLMARLCQRYAVRPCYLVDYPVVSQDDGWRPLAELAADNLCEIGAHLHPWVNPPLVEEVSVRNSYPGNLPAALEREKLAELAEAIARRFGGRPVTYRAGRYGVGRETAGILEDLGFETDTSVVPRSDFGVDAGPDFRRCDVGPYWWQGRARRMLELPLMVGWVGLLAGGGALLQPMVNSAPGRALGLGGVLSRARLYERIRLSPEGTTLHELVRLTTAMLGRHQRVFNFTFHSPSLAPGHTPYVRGLRDRERFLEIIEGYFEHFMGRLGGQAETPGSLRAKILAAEGAG